MIAPQVKGIGPSGLEPPARARTRRKATVKTDKTPLKRRCHKTEIPDNNI